MIFAVALTFVAPALIPEAHGKARQKHSYACELTALKPSLNQAIASVNVVQLLQQNAYDQISLDDLSSEKIFNSYLVQLDKNHTYLLQSDIKSFFRYTDSLDGALKSGNLKPAFEIFNRYLQRTKERIEFNLKTINTGIAKLGFPEDDELEIDREEADWLKDKKEQKALWLKLLKDSVLAMRLNHKTDNEIEELLGKRFKNQQRRLCQTRNEDAFQLYLNAFTQLYDPHTQYFSPQVAEAFDINMSLSLEGIGAVLQAEDEYTRVLNLLPAGPARKAGQLKPGDKIIAVSQGDKEPFEDVVGMRLDEVVKYIRGPKGTKVLLEIIPADSPDGKTRVYSIVRDKVRLEEQAAQKEIVSLKHGKRTYKLGVVNIPAFYIDFKAAQAGDPEYKSTTRDVRRLLRELSDKKVDGFIIDLRNNGGGSLQEANQLTGLFIPEGPIVQVRDSRGRTELQQDPDPQEVFNEPMVVLINRLSASASEIFAGAMQDYQRALIVGGQSFGKGTVQTIQPLNHGHLKLTIAKFYRVSGLSTQHRGVVPDISFPSLYANSEVGEGALPNALPWDSIKPAQFNIIQPILSYLPKLTKLHNARVKNDPDFAYYKQLLALQEELNQKKTVSLNFEKRKYEVDTFQKKRLNIENILRQSKGKTLFNNMEALEKEQDSLYGTFLSARKESDSVSLLEEDAFLREAGHILSDYIEISLKYVAGTSGSKVKISNRKLSDR